MKKVTIVFLLILPYCLRAQIVDNVLEFLVYDQQDSLVKSLSVKKISIKKRAVKPKRFTMSIVEKEFNKQGLKISLLREFSTSDFASLSKFSYDEKKNLKEEKKIKKKSKLEEPKSQNKFNSEAYLNSLSSSRIVKNPNKLYYRYDSLNKLSIIKRCKGKLCNIDKYYYIGDTTKVYTFDDKEEQISLRQSLKQKYYKEDFFVNTSSDFTSAKKIEYDSVQRTQINKSWFKGKMNSHETLFFDNNHKVLSMVRINRIHGATLFKEGEGMARIVTNYLYKDGILIGCNISEKGLGKEYKKQVKYEYFDNGLLKRIVSISNNSNSKTYEDFTYEFF